MPHAKQGNLPNHLYKRGVAVPLNHYFCFMEVNDAMLTKLASLAKIRFDAAEQQSIKNDLERMISFVQKMDEVDTSNIEPLQHMAATQNVWREDVINGSCTKEEALKNAGKHNEIFFMVPKVIKK